LNQNRASARCVGAFSWREPVFTSLENAIEPSSRRFIVRENAMGSMGRKNEPPKQTDDKANKPPLPRADDEEDFEDGDIATPKRDRYGNDDEPI
jgi:hypothetical protein